jgi:hypothetical protein
MGICPVVMIVVASGLSSNPATPEISDDGPRVDGPEIPGIIRLCPRVPAVAEDGADGVVIGGSEVVVVVDVDVDDGVVGGGSPSAALRSACPAEDEILRIMVCPL